MSRHPSILVVDDDVNDQHMILAALSGHAAGMSVCTVQDGAEALDYLHCRGTFKDREPGNPDVVLLDLNMPRIDGWDVLRQTKSVPTLRTIPVVVFTSSARDSDVAQCYELGANAFVVKPIDLEEFTQTVRDIQAFWAGRNHPFPAVHAAGAGSPVAEKAGVTA